MNKLLFPLSVGLLLCGCGGSSSSSDSVIESSPVSVIKQGFIKDGALSGVNYKSKSKTGITGEQGQFEYVEGEDIEFFLGSLKFGTVKASPLVTPMELTKAALYTETAPTNMVRLLMALDEDGDAENGIQISDATREHFSQSADVSQIDFASLSFESDVSSTIDNQGNVIYLPSPEEANQHFEDTLKCAYSGLFVGEYDGDDSGTFGAIIEPEKLSTIGSVVASDRVSFPLRAEAPLSVGENKKFIHWGLLGQGSEVATFIGELTDYNYIDGNWSWPELGGSGQWRGDRISTGNEKALFKYVGGYLYNPLQDNISEDMLSGLFQLVIDADGRVDVQSYDLMDKTLSFSTSQLDDNGNLELILANGDWQSKVTLSSVLPESRGYVEEVVTDNDGNDIGFGMVSCRL